MARNLTDLLGNFPDYRLLNMPVGTATLLSVAFGLSAGVGDIVDRLMQFVLPAGMWTKVPAVLAQAGIAWTVSNVKFINGLLGTDVADLVSATALTSGINDAVKLSDLIRIGLDKVAVLIPQKTVTPAIAQTTTQTAATQPVSGYNMGQVRSAARTASPNVDDMDLALLAARGYPVS